MFKKIQKLSVSPQFKKLMLLAMCLSICMCMFCVFAAAEGTGADMTAQEAATSIFGQLTEHINVGTVVAVIGIALGAGMALYFAWWGIKWVARAVKKGLNGKTPVG